MTCHRRIWFCTSLCLLASQGVSSDPEQVSLYQERRLISPTYSELERERRGEVFVYSGMRDEQVDHALDEQFHRIESMMFINILRPGAEEQEDECD